MTSKKEEQKVEELQDVEIYLQEDRYITTLNGDKIKVPKLAWGKEIKLAKQFSEAVKRVPNFIAFLQDFGGINLGSKKVDLQAIAAKGMGKLPQILPEVIDNIPDVLTKSASIMLDKDEKWIEDNLDFEAVFELVFPFFVQFFKKLIDKVGRLGSAVPGIGNLFSA